MRLFQKQGHKIIHGNTSFVLKTEIEPETIDLIFIDPPYNIGKQFSNFHDKWSSVKDYVSWCCDWIDMCIKLLKPNGSLYFMTSTQAMPYLDIYIQDKLHILSRIIWSYDSSGMQAKNFYGSLYEPILFCVKDKKNYKFNADAIMVEAKTGSQRKLIDYRKSVPTPYNTKKVPGNVWEFPRVRYRMKEYENHPSQKPEALLRRIILASSDINDVILDPFAGSFTTASVAKKLNRQSISIESQEEYIKIGLRRVLDMNILDGVPLSYPVKNYNCRDNHILQKELFHDIC